MVFGMELKLVRVKVVVEAEVLTTLFQIGMRVGLEVTPEIMLVAFVKRVHNPVKVNTI
mgnify:CR=1 FL=1